jgi:hypothetical protein
LLFGEAEQKLRIEPVEGVRQRYTVLIKVKRSCSVSSWAAPFDDFFASFFGGIVSEINMGSHQEQFALSSLHPRWWLLVSTCYWVGFGSSMHASGIYCSVTARKRWQTLTR